MDKDEIFNREGLTPQQYLEFTERFIPENETTTHNETVMIYCYLKQFYVNFYAGFNFLNFL